jgi:hypothetical protein
MGRFLTGSCLNEVDASAVFSRTCSFDSIGIADGDALEEDVSLFVLADAGEESLAA